MLPTAHCFSEGLPMAPTQESRGEELGAGAGVSEQAPAGASEAGQLPLCRVTGACPSLPSHAPTGGWPGRCCPPNSDVCVYTEGFSG